MNLFIVAFIYLASGIGLFAYIMNMGMGLIKGGLNNMITGEVPILGSGSSGKDKNNVKYLEKPIPQDPLQQNSLNSMQPASAVSAQGESIDASAANIHTNNSTDMPGIDDDDDNDKDKDNEALIPDSVDDPESLRKIRGFLSQMGQTYYQPMKGDSFNIAQSGQQIVNVLSTSAGDKENEIPNGTNNLISEENLNMVSRLNKLSSLPIDENQEETTNVVAIRRIINGDSTQSISFSKLAPMLLPESQHYTGNSVIPALGNDMDINDLKILDKIKLYALYNNMYSRLVNELGEEQGEKVAKELAQDDRIMNVAQNLVFVGYADTKSSQNESADKLLELFKQNLRKDDKHHLGGANVVGGDESSEEKATNALGAPSTMIYTSGRGNSHAVLGSINQGKGYDTRGEVAGNEVVISEISEKNGSIKENIKTRNEKRGKTASGVAKNSIELGNTNESGSMDTRSQEGVHTMESRKDNISETELGQRGLEGAARNKSDEIAERIVETLSTVENKKISSNILRSIFEETGSKSEDIDLSKLVRAINKSMVNGNIDYNDISRILKKYIQEEQEDSEFLDIDFQEKIHMMTPDELKDALNSDDLSEEDKIIVAAELEKRELEETDETEKTGETEETPTGNT